MELYFATLMQGIYLNRPRPRDYFYVKRKS